MGVLLVPAGAAFGLALGTLTAFFLTRDVRFDRVAEWSFAAFAALAVGPILGLRERLPDVALASGATLVGAAGVAVLGLVELGLALKLVDFRRVATLTSLAFLAFLAWMAGVCVAMLGGEVFPAGLAWLGIGCIGLAGLVVASMALTPGALTGRRDPSSLQMLAFVAPTAGIVVWLCWLGIRLGAGPVG